MDKITVVVCEDVEDVRDYVVSIVNQQPDMEVVGVADSEKTAVSEVERTRPDIVLMDIQMDTEKAGISATETIKSLYPHIKTVILTVHADDDNILDAYAAGAVDFIMKSMDKGAIAESIRKVHNEEHFIGPLIAQKLHSEFVNLRKKERSMLYIINELAQLTPKETKILRMLYEGRTKKQISVSETLEISTIKFHINNILRKLHYTNTRDLINDLKELEVFDNILK